VKKNQLLLSTKIQGIITEYFKDICSNKLKNVEELDKFLDTYDLPKLNSEAIDNIKRDITSRD
jgi:hypothetical protein